MTYNVYNFNWLTNKLKTIRLKTKAFLIFTTLLMLSIKSFMRSNFTSFLTSKDLSISTSTIKKKHTKFESILRAPYKDKIGQFQIEQPTFEVNLCIKIYLHIMRYHNFNIINILTNSFIFFESITLTQISKDIVIYSNLKFE